MRATNISSEEGSPEEGSPGAVAGAAAAIPWRVNAIDIEFPLQSRPAQSSRQGQIGSLIYFSKAPEPFRKFHRICLEPFPGRARLMVKWRVGRPPIPPDHPLPSEKSRKRSTKPRSQRGFAFWRNLRVPQPARFLTRQFWAPGVTPGKRRHRRPLSPKQGELQRLCERENSRRSPRSIAAPGSAH